MNETTITRRTALRTTVLSVIGAGLMAAAGTRPEPAHAEPVADIDRAEALLLEVERIMMGLDELARADLGFELDRLGSLAVAADPAAFVAEHERGTGANRLSAADPIELDRPDDRAFHGPVGRPAGPILLAARHCTEWTRPRRTVRNQCPRQVGWMHERPRPREGEWLMSIAVATPPRCNCKKTVVGAVMARDGDVSSPSATTARLGASATVLTADAVGVTTRKRSQALGPTPDVSVLNLSLR